MQFYGARLEQYWSSTAGALQQYWSRFAEILLKQRCNSIGAVLEEFPVAQSSIAAVEQ